MKDLRKVLAVVVPLLIGATILLGPAAEPAQADRCQPEEIVMPPLMDESESPVCWVMLGYVYPSLDCDRSSLMNCIATLNAPNTVKTQLNCIGEPVPSPNCPLIDPVIP